jgi:beta-glucanase (GH16 family)
MRHIACNLKQSKRTARAGSLLLGTITGLMVLQSRLGSAAGLPPAVPSQNGLPWVQTFSDDFTGPTGSLSGWTTMLGTGSQYGLTGWGNNEAETYTADSSNLNISNGALNIVAQVHNQGTNVTSARIATQNLFSQAYGLFQFTAKLPAGSDLWPALWLLPKPTSSTADLASGVYGGWPNSGEIDVMESGLGHSLPPTSQVQGTFHSGASPGADQSQTGFYNTGNDASFSTTNLNTYDLLWLPGTDTHTPGTLQWYVNGKLYETRSGGWYNPPGATNATAPFDQPFYFVMNLAVGGPNTPYTGKQTPVDGTYAMQITDVEAFAFSLPGDFDQNGHVNANDLAAMMSALSNKPDFALSHGLTADQLRLIGDLNGDGQFTNADLPALLARLSSGGGSPSVPEPATFVLLVLGAIGFVVPKKCQARSKCLQARNGIAETIASRLQNR